MAISDSDRIQYDLRRQSYAAGTGLDGGCFLIVLAGVGIWRNWSTVAIVFLALFGVGIFIRQAIVFTRTGFFGNYSPIFEESEQTKELKRIAYEHRLNQEKANPLIQ